MHAPPSTHRSVILIFEMREGWHGNDYLILFDGAERTDAAARYALHKYLPDYALVGLKSWDDFIVQSPTGRVFSIPTVPIDASHFAPFNIALDSIQLQPDSRFTGSVKWYTKPILFGGDPSDKANIAWVTVEQHAHLVKYWNELYQSMK